MKNKISSTFLMALVFLLYQASFSQQTFEKYYSGFSGSLSSAGQCVAPDSEGGYTVLGSLFYDADMGFLMIKVSTSGDTIKTVRFDGSGTNFHTGEGGNVIVTGARAEKMLMMKLDAGFNPVWENFPEMNSATGRSVCTLSGKEYCFAGVIYPILFQHKILYVVKTDENGEMLWERSFGGDGADLEVNSVVATPDGGMMVCGNFRLKNEGAISLGVMKISASGDSLWMKCYRRTDQSRGYVILPAHPDGYFLAGTDQPDSGPIELYLVRIDEGGDTLWTRHYAGIKDAMVLGATATSGGGYAIAATREIDSLNGPDLFLIRLNEGGDTLWTRPIGGRGTQSGRSIQQTADGGFIVTGYGKRDDMSGSAIYLVKTDSLGNYVPYSIDNKTVILPDVRISPNPSNGIFRIVVSGFADHIELLDMRGNTIEYLDCEPESNAVYTLNLEMIPAGIYLLRVYSQEGVSVKKLIKIRGL